MIVYLVVFILSLLFIYIGFYTEKKHKFFGRFIMIIGISIPCILASCRAIEVGTDTKGYVYRLFRLAQNEKGLNNFFKVADKWYNITDYMYIPLTYYVAHIFNNFKIFLFIIELLIILPIFYVLYNNKKNIFEIMIGMTLFFLFEYNVSFNMVRQCLAISFIILMIYYLYRNKLIHSIISLLIACGFHKTAIICVVFYPVYLLYTRVADSKVKKITILFIYLFILIITLFFKEIVMVLSNIGIYSRGQSFLDEFSTEFDFSFIDTTTYLILFLPYFLDSKKYELNKNVRKFSIFIGYTSLVTLSLGWTTEYLERISFYFFYPFIIFIIPLYLSKKNDKNQKLYTIFIIIYFIIYWLFVFVILKKHNTVPYIFNK